jgi:hypothetical protein
LNFKARGGLRLIAGRNHGMFEHTRNNRRQTFDRIGNPMLFHDISDRMRPLIDGVSAIRAKLADAFSQSARALGINNQLLAVRLLDPLGKGAHEFTSCPEIIPPPARRREKPCVTLASVRALVGKPPVASDSTKQPRSRRKLACALAERARCPAPTIGNDVMLRLAQPIAAFFKLAGGHRKNSHSIEVAARAYLKYIFCVIVPRVPNNP